MSSVAMLDVFDIFIVPNVFIIIFSAEFKFGLL